MALHHSTGRERYQAWLARQKAFRKQRADALIEALKQIPAPDLAYAAGIIDGEGCICIHPRKERRTFSGTVAVAMCEPEAIMFLYQTFGGNPPKFVKPRAVNHRPQLTWSLGANKAANFCVAILPFLKIKKQQALNLVELQQINRSIRDSTTVQRVELRNTAHMVTFGPAPCGGFEISPKLLRRCHELHQSQAHLNHRKNKAHEATAQTSTPSASAPSNSPVVEDDEPTEAAA